MALFYVMCIHITTNYILYKLYKVIINNGATDIGLFVKPFDFPIDFDMKYIPFKWRHCLLKSPLVIKNICQSFWRYLNIWRHFSLHLKAFKCISIHISDLMWIHSGDQRSSEIGIEICWKQFFLQILLSSFLLAPVLNLHLYDLRVITCVTAAIYVS